MEQIKEFTTVHNARKFTFNDIWKIYDSQFEYLRQFLMNLGDKYSVQVFSGDVSKTLVLDHPYSSGQLFLYRNNVIQWKDIDYKEISSRKIELLFSRELEDEIKCVIVFSNIVNNIDLLDLKPWNCLPSEVRDRDPSRPSYGIPG